jgi:hypothetical protein
VAPVGASRIHTQELGTVHRSGGQWDENLSQSRDTTAICVKELEMLPAKRPTEPRFRVFAQASSDDGFLGFAPESAPPALEALAS